MPDKSVSKRIGIFGGTFDPVHQGHIHVAGHLCRRLQLEEIHLVLALQPPHRTAPQATSAQRWQMLQLALENSSELVADDRELRRHGSSYSYDTVCEIRDEQEFGGAIALCMGWDSLVSLPGWYRWRELLELCTLVVVNRPHHAHSQATLDDELTRRLIPATETDDLEAGQIVEIEVPAQPVSATQIRESLAAGRELPDGWLHPAVEHYIKQNQLYGT